MRWEDDNPAISLGSANRLIIRRAKIDVKIILRESSEASKYELFQRLNTGGSQLSDQELRNAILVMVNPDAFRWIEYLAKDECFQSCVALSDRLTSEKYDLELVTRFVVFRNLAEEELGSIGDIGEFLTDRIVELAQSDRFSEAKAFEERAFRSTFANLGRSLGDRSFKKYDVSKGRYLGGFLISAFEPIALGLGYNFEHYDSDGEVEKIVAVSKELWTNRHFLKHSGSGVRASTRLPSNIPLGRHLFAP